jgi:hypothetical protein
VSVREDLTTSTLVLIGPGVRAARLCTKGHRIMGWAARPLAGAVRRSPARAACSRRARGGVR